MEIKIPDFLSSRFYRIVFREHRVSLVSSELNVEDSGLCGFILQFPSNAQKNDLKTDNYLLPVTVVTKMVYCVKAHLAACQTLTEKGKSPF